MSMYSLTGMTGRRKNDERKIQAATFSFNRFNLIAVLGSAALSIPVAALVAAGLNPFGWSSWAIAVPFFGAIAGLYLTSRVKDGQQRQYDKILDGRRARSGKGLRGVSEDSIIYVAGEPLVEAQMFDMVQSFIPNPAYIAARDAEAFGGSKVVPAIGTADTNRDQTVNRSCL